ncbi:MAG: hypothetical protein HWE07_09215 [Cytophagia bacterium]|nr:hypothetical protein [Cytophagia bacterium]
MGTMNDIAAPVGSNMGGLVDVIYSVPLADVDLTALAALVSPMNADGKTMEADLPLKTDKKFYSLYFTKGMGKLDYPLVGETDGKSREIMLDIKIPGTTAAIESVIDAICVGPQVQIARDAEGRLRLLGINLRDDGTLAADWPMYIDTDAATTGAAAADKKGHNPIWKGASNYTPLFYTGDIDLTGAA